MKYLHKLRRDSLFLNLNQFNRLHKTYQEISNFIEHTRFSLDPIKNIVIVLDDT